MSALLKCPCGNTFKNDRLYGRHTNDCARFQARLHAAAHKRKAQNEARRQEKRRRGEEREAEAEEWHGLGTGEEGDQDEDVQAITDLLDPAAFPSAAPSNYERVPSAFRSSYRAHKNIPLPSPTSASVPRASDPLPNMSQFRLLEWQYKYPNTSSNRAVNALVRDVILAPGFSPSDFPPGFTIESAQAQLESEDTQEDVQAAFPVVHGWRNAHVLIRVPKEGVKFTSEEAAPQYTVDDVLIRDLLDIFVDTYESPAARDFHFTPHKTLWRVKAHSASTSTDESAPSEVQDSRVVRILTDFYNADEVLEADAELQAHPRNPDDPPDLEYAIGPILLWSDLTHLADFGTASLWPIYAYTGLQSKYTRGRPTCFSAQHIAYIPSLPDDFTDWFMDTFDGTAPRAELLTFCRRELYQAVILLLLDERFLDAYRHGILVSCGDEIRRHMFPRFLIHSADYVEKILATCLKYLAKCPCPRCYIDKEKIPEMGVLNDLHRRNKVREDNTDIQARIRLARKWIFEDGVPLTSVWLKRTLDPMSLTPTRVRSTSRWQLQLAFGFNFYSMYVPDLMHEFELGVWKSTLTHLVRILHALGGEKVQQFNERYRMIPTFGRNTIRRFVNNMADLKKLAARDYEDSLQAIQCSMAVFDGLPNNVQDNNIILDMLFDDGCWHALAKLRLHTDDTVDLLDVATVNVGQSTRRFTRITCTRYDTYELPRETARKRKSFSLKTYKYHSLWDYAAHIRRFGPSDNWTTQIGELEHRHVKRFYARTNKHQHARQIARHIHLEDKIRKKAAMLEQAHQHQSQPESSSPLGNRSLASPEATGQHARSPCAESCDPRQQYHIAESEREYDDISAWVAQNQGDPAFKNFQTCLYDHLIARLKGHAFQGEEPECSVADRSALRFVANRIYHHHRMRLNYTTYDMRRSQDVIDPTSHPDIMTLSHEDDDNTHPYWYARVIHIFHVNVYRSDAAPGTPASRPQRMDILWIRWFGLDPTSPHGFKAKRHPRVGFVPHDDGIPFGFLNPAVVIRASHIIPLFSYHHTPGLLPPSIARHGQNTYEKPEFHDCDYQYYMVNMFVDRDMFMRYLGGGVGHVHTGADIQVAFDDGDFTWEDVDPEAADLFEASDDELELGSSNSHIEAGSRPGTAANSVTPEERILQLVRGLDAGWQEQHGEPSSEPNEDEDEDEDEDINADEADDDDDDEHGTGFVREADEGEDEYAQEGYAAD
ncbi:hypothetical protein L226DRAFT_548591 [Lentinus tigrinus ALCF2SS1-7]|uniref:Uncharacterized protein n=1 Tax=Lentinus tigrinus ALCF2SS1-6 TaxID=1328759 RepID=A0A5C2RPJ7_9APHY|nr:hypothetical protein L227DRAFT_589409 [Lentinus tigrinus ALCF2SS1-6]RPD68319.1 hypothetical protein L226DRAFT_548591 [Lentinus tigrinus ALCF2SS1-7]